MQLVLASASPRRAELLRAASISFEVMPAEIDESLLLGETPEAHVRRLAEAKARAVIPRAGERPVLAADTVVVVDGEVLGKPVDADDAARMLRLLSGRAHEVMTAVCLAGPSKAGHYVLIGPAKAGHYVLIGPAEAGRYVQTEVAVTTQTEVAVTTVEFAPLTEAEIAWYIGSGESADKAGAYAIQGLASRFVTLIEGSYANVVGLPVALVYDLCKRMGILIS